MDCMIVEPGLLHLKMRKFPLVVLPLQEMKEINFITTFVCLVESLVPLCLVKSAYLEYDSIIIGNCELFLHRLHVDRV
uniref:Uncharacterized protein n=1 Tax=Rhizophora mucronata TaxID=61149 RepID=A0A2P2NA55_RHIMU